MRGLAIHAVGTAAWSALAVGAVGAGLLSGTLALLTPKPASTLSAAASALDPPRSDLEHNLNALLAGFLGPGQAVVSGNSQSPNDRTAVTPLRYGRRGIALNASGARTSFKSATACMRRRIDSTT